MKNSLRWITIAGLLLAFILAMGLSGNFLFVHVALMTILIWGGIKFNRYCLTYYPNNRFLPALPFLLAAAVFLAFFWMYLITEDVEHLLIGLLGLGIPGFALLGFTIYLLTRRMPTGVTKNEKAP